MTSLLTAGPRHLRGPVQAAAAPWWPVLGPAPPAGPGPRGLSSRPAFCPFPPALCQIRRGGAHANPWPGPPPSHTCTHQGLPTPSLPSFLATAASFSESTSPKPTPLSSRTWAANWREHRDGISSGAPSHPIPISRFPERSLGTGGREELPLARPQGSREPPLPREPTPGLWFCFGPWTRLLVGMELPTSLCKAGAGHFQAPGDAEESDFRAAQALPALGLSPAHPHR